MLCAKLTYLIAELDKCLNSMLNDVLHHPDFQTIESAWRSLYDTIYHSNVEKSIKVKLLPLTFQELKTDLLIHSDFVQSHIFQKIYSDHFDMAGGEPIGVWIGNYTFDIKKNTEIEVLRQISELAAASFCPFLSMISFTSMGIDHTNWHRLESFDFLMNPEFTNWKNLRQSPHARFINLMLPPILLREPHDNTVLPFCFKEEVTNINDYLWGNTAFALAQVILNSFSEYSWFSFMQGEPFGEQTAGLFDNGFSRPHTSHSHFNQLITKVYITEEQERSLNRQGLIALFSKQYDKSTIFYHLPSISNFRREADGLSEITTIDHLLPYLLCVSRFAHYLKVICRDKIGSYKNPDAVEKYLHDWLLKYCAANDDLPLQSFGQYPLKDAKIAVFLKPGDENHYQLRIELQPRINLIGIDTTFVLFSQIPFKE